MTISTSASTDGNILTIHIKGQFFFQTILDFRQAYGSGHDPHQQFIVDLSETQDIDSAGLGMLLKLRDHATRQGKSVSIMGSNPNLRSLLSRAKFDKLFALK